MCYSCGIQFKSNCDERKLISDIYNMRTNQQELPSWTDRSYNDSDDPLVTMPSCCLAGVRCFMKIKNLELEETLFCVKYERIFLKKQFNKDGWRKNILEKCERVNILHSIT